MLELVADDPVEHRQLGSGTLIVVVLGVTLPASSSDATVSTFCTEPGS